jgi:hypothetical protein
MKDEYIEDKLLRVDMLLRDILVGAGPFSKDPLVHASNTIESMKALAKQALQIIEG